MSSMPGLDRRTFVGTGGALGARGFWCQRSSGRSRRPLAAAPPGSPCGNERAAVAGDAVDGVQELAQRRDQGELGRLAAGDRRP
jgi:hypothetical protein